MRLKTLKIRNFRCFEDRTLTFAPQFNLLIGENGTGKTVALEAVACVLGAWLKGFPKVKERPLGEADIRRTSRVRGDQLHTEMQSLVGLYVVAEMDGSFVQWQRERFLLQRVSHSGAVSILRLAQKAAAAVSAHEDITLPLLSYYGTRRLWDVPNAQKPRHGSKHGEGASRLDGYKFSLDPRTSTDLLIDWLITQEWTAYQERRESEVLRAVKSTITSCLDGCRDIRYDAKLKAIMVSFHDGEYLGFHILSDGQRNMMAMVADIAIKACTLNPHLGARAAHETPGVVLIDELDLHLHPKWQRRIIDDLKRVFPKIQFIATTHSPFLVQALKPGELIKLGEVAVQDELQEYKKQSIEDIAVDHMGMKEEHVARSREYHLKMKAAEEYFRKLREPGVTTAELEALEEEYLKRLEHFGEDPAFFAALRIERESEGGSSPR